jgi:hypothetical protein
MFVKCEGWWASEERAQITHSQLNMSCVRTHKQIAISVTSAPSKNKPHLGVGTRRQTTQHLGVIDERGEQGWVTSSDQGQITSQTAGWAMGSRTGVRRDAPPRGNLHAHAKRREVTSPVLFSLKGGGGAHTLPSALSHNDRAKGLVGFAPRTRPLD